MRLKTIIFSLFTFIITGISSCARTPDVRIVLCQDMTIKLLNTNKSDLEWIKEAKVIIKQYNEAQIILKYQLGSDTGQSICQYPFERIVEVGDVEESINPLSIYSTYPEQVNLNNNITSGQKLTDLVKEVMLIQGKDFIKKIESHTQN